MGRRGRTTAVAGALALVAAVAPAADAAPYVASCNSGVLAPQLCTFVASGVVAAFAAPGQHLVLTRRALSLTPSACPDGARPNAEEYRGLLRGTHEVQEITLWLQACPGRHPLVHAQTDDRTAHGAKATVHPPESGKPAWLLFGEGEFHGRLHSVATGSLFRRDTGMSSYTSGATDECEYRSSNGLCEMGGNRDHAYYARLDSSISGHWARLQLAITAEHPEVRSRTVRVTAAPYGSGGWKITRVA